jgi:putative DNA primase/helicase
MSAPPFPREVLGKPWALWCEATAAAANAPYDYVAASLITCGAALIGNARVVEFGAWIEPSAIWTVLSGSPSSGKSPAMSPLKRAMGDLEGELVTLHDPEMGPEPQLRVGDVTAQALVQVAAVNEKGLLLQLDELSGWWSQINRTGGEQLWLEAYGGGSYTHTRVGKPTIRIDRLTVSVLGTTQPAPLSELLTAKSDKGFSARCLYVFPEPMSGFQRPMRLDHEHAMEGLRRLRDLELANGKPVACPLNEEAEDVAANWINSHLAEEKKSSGAWEQWLGKQRGMLLRYALVLQHLWWAMEENDAPLAEIGPEAIQAAATFIDGYAKPMAARCFGMANRPLSERDAAFLVSLLARNGVHEFNARALRRGELLGPVGTLADAKRMEEACALLVTANLIRKNGQRSGGTKGTSSTTLTSDTSSWQASFWRRPQNSAMSGSQNRALRGRWSPDTA